MLNEYVLPETFLSESVFASFHKRSTSQMADAHKNALTKKGHTVLHHQTTNDSHTIHYKSATSKKIRTSTITPLKRKYGIVTKIDNRPASQETKNQFSNKK